jgi:putative membrane protein
LLAAQTVALAMAHALGRIPVVRRWLLQDTLIEQSVRARAARAFAEHGLAGTEARTGILILVAVLERRVVVLADEGIERALMEGESWQDVVDLATAGLRQKRAADGIEAAVRRCGEILSRAAPQIGTPVDELPRSVIVEG